MSRSGFGLLVGWLTEGVGGEALGAGEGFSGERGKRGRSAVMRVVNNHLKFDGKYKDVIYRAACPNTLSSHELEYSNTVAERMGGIHRPPFFADTTKQWHDLH